ncbi:MULTISPECIES: hypothetical protein [unclassified Roseateles]|uniref:hypothetical protein n=1 Tax=unclassified Roseateles TaxID=2626991 RepID=UPI000A605BF9|nr:MULTISPECIES: hypothetical protein [unclassified Roseateles]
MSRPPAALPTLALLLAGAVQAARPLQTEDAPVMERGACEIEGLRAAARQGGERQRQTGLQLGCGIGWRSEIALQALRPRELVLSGKTRLATHPVRDGDAQLTLAWSLAQRHVQAGWRRSASGLVLVASAPLNGDWLMHANLGHQRDEVARLRSTTWGLAAEHNGLGEDGRWQPMAEVVGDDRGRPWAHAALRVALLPERVFVDGSAGTQLRRQSGGRRARLATLGFKLAY